MGSNPYATYVLQRLHEYEPAPLKAECAELKLVSRRNLAILVPPQFMSGSTVPESGQWIDQVFVDRCGAQTQRNLLIVARGQRQLQAIRLLPGGTVASPLLQRDAMMVAMLSATEQIGCDHLATAVVSTTVSGIVALNEPWHEDWTFAGCGRTAVVSITFTPDGKGGTHFSAKMRTR